MCGILGIVCPRHERVALPRESFSHALELLSHRGPDSDGVWDGGNVLLGHRRLTVMDPSGAGAQPMHFDDASGKQAGVLVYNGELYNTNEIRTTLCDRGSMWPDARSDARWFGRALMEFGHAATAHPRLLRGMFAAGYLDLRADLLLLTRDPLGVKPLYYARVVSRGTSHVAFASELPALVSLVSSLTNSTPQPDMIAVSAYLTTIRTTLGDRTLFQGCKAVLPGQTLTFDLTSDTLACKVSMRTPEAPADFEERRAPSHRTSRPRVASDLTEREIVEGTHAVITDSVLAHLDSDVPRCALLSGGLDSAIITSIAAKHLRGRGQQFQTFCAGARDGETEGPDFAFARAFAVQLGTLHHEAAVTHADFSQAWPSMVHRIGLPLSTPNEVAIHAVSRLLRAKGCVVALSGEGADELFCGYDTALDMAFAHEQQGGADPGLFTLTANAWVPLDAKSSLLQDRAFDGANHDETLAAWYREEFARAGAERANDHRLQPHARFLRRVNLLGLLQRVDTGTMLAGVEARTPFADARVMDWAEALPLSSKFDTDKTHSLRTKRVLRAAFAHAMPADIVNRPKASFPLPFERWISADGFFDALSHAAGCDSLLNSDFASHVFQRDALETVVNLARTHWHLAWPVFNLLLWGNRWWGRGSCSADETLAARGVAQ